MASQSDLAAFQRGKDTWSECHQTSEHQLNLSETDFKNKVLFKKYLNDDNDLDYSGVNFSNCVLDGADFGQCILVNCNFKKAHLKNCIFTDSTITNAKFDGAMACGAKFSLAQGDNTHFRYANLTAATFSEGKFNKSQFHKAIFKDAQILGTEFEGANFSGVEDFFSRWTTNIWGTPRFPEYPVTPIELIYGLNPHTRKALADGMYLKALWKKYNKGWKRTMLRLWGMSCGYGQDVTRWVVFSFALTLFFANCYTFSEMNIATLQVDKITHQHIVTSIVAKPDLLTALYYSIITFVTLGYGDIIPISPMGRILAMIEVCIGYIMLGGLVSIFSNKLARLS